MTNRELAEKVIEFPSLNYIQSFSVILPDWIMEDNNYGWRFIFEFTRYAAENEMKTEEVCNELKAL